MLKTLLIRFGWVVFERSQKVSKKKRKKIDGHNFLCKKKLVVTAYTVELPTTRFSH